MQQLAVFDVVINIVYSERSYANVILVIVLLHWLLTGYDLMPDKQIMCMTDVVN